MLDLPATVAPTPPAVDLAVPSAAGTLPARYYAASTPAGHPVVGVLLLGTAGPWRLFARLADALAGAGYPLLALDRLEALASDARPDAIAAALDLLRRRAAAAHLAVVATADQAAAVAGARADGLAVLGTRLPPPAAADELVAVFDALEPYGGALLALGAGETEELGGGVQALFARAVRWRHERLERHLELGVLDGPRATLPLDADHTLAPSAYVGMVCDFVRQWLDRRFGPGYPRAWQGPPPTPSTAPSPQAASPDDPAAWVPLLAPGARLLPTPASGYLALPSGRQFALTPPLAAFVRLIDGHRPLATIAAQLAPQLARPVSPAQLAHLLTTKLAPLGVVTPDARGDGGEADSGMTDILIRCYQPHDRFRQLLANLTRVTRSPYNVIAVVGKRHAVRNQNLALDRVRTRYAVFLDDDVLLTDGWLERLRETMDRTGAGAVSGRQLRMNGEPLSTAAACGEHRAIVEALSGGACFMFRTDLGLRFDERFVRSQWDDVDFMFQLYERGYRTYIDGRVDFYHHNDPKVWRAQNLVYFVNKWLAKGLLRGWAMYTYDRLGTAFMPCFGPVAERADETGENNA
jgi:hypothetical protein